MAHRKLTGLKPLDPDDPLADVQPQQVDPADVLTTGAQNPTGLGASNGELHRRRCRA